MRPDYVRDLVLLPRRRVALLAGAIGARLEDVVRRVWIADDLPRPTLAERPPAWLGETVGNTELRFGGGIVHALAPEPEWLSVLVLDRSLDHRDGVPHAASALDASHPLRRVLGRTCTDVRIWTLVDDVPGDEAKECAIAYELGDVELVYGSYLDGANDGDAIVLRPAGSPPPAHRARSVRDTRPARSGGS